MMVEPSARNNAWKLSRNACFAAQRGRQSKTCPKAPRPAQMPQAMQAITKDFDPEIVQYLSFGKHSEALAWAGIEE
jgi:hypothetical protein